MAKLDASKSGTFKIGGEIEINRLGFGAMRITGKGIWGEPDQTGKSSADDLRQGKKTYPVLLGLERSSEFARLWSVGRRDSPEIEPLQRALEACAADRQTRERAEAYTQEAMLALEQADPRPPAAAELEDLARRLLQRDR